MFEIVPSQWMKKCFEEIDFAFTDFQKATLIWNAPGRLRQEIFDALEELAEDTRDETLGRQINERLNYEKKIFETFIHNQSGKYVYVVENLEYENGGFFSDYNRALKYAKKYMQIYELKCRISKQMIVDTDADEIVRNPLRGNPNLGFETEEYCAYDGTAVASVTLNMSGEIEQFNSYELPEDEKIVDSYQVERFEYHFIKMPCPLQAGTTVKDMGCVSAIREAFIAAKGGVLFIDEAYAMKSDTAITVLLQEMENQREDVIVILAGYNERMKAFMKRNEGLKSRIPYWIDFPDYTAEELTDIFKLMIHEKGFCVTDDAIKEAHYIFEKVRNIDDFGNGRYVRNLMERAVR